MILLDFADVPLCDKYVHETTNGYEKRVTTKEHGHEFKETVAIYCASAKLWELTGPDGKRLATIFETERLNVEISPSMEPIRSTSNRDEIYFVASGSVKCLRRSRKVVGLLTALRRSWRHPVEVH